MIVDDRESLREESLAPSPFWSGAAADSPPSRERLLEMCYSELRMLARRLLSGDSAAHRLQPTELANEVALRVLKLDRMEWTGRAHFLATAATVMRQALIDEVRRFRAGKRQAPPVLTTFVDQGIRTVDVDLERLDRSLRRLTQVSPERGRLVELRFFVGLTVEATADALGLSPATVKRQWDAARAWLLRDLARA